jgi:hypothetical protein
LRQIRHGQHKHGQAENGLAGVFAGMKIFVEFNDEFSAGGRHCDEPE